jgi:membrane protease YdiL (CAAX protease family)
LFRARLRDIAWAVLAVVTFAATWVVLAWLVDKAQATLIGPDSWWVHAGRGLLAEAVPPLVAALALYAGIVWLTPWGLGRLRVPRGRAALRGLALGVTWGAGLALAVLGLSLAGGARLMAQPGAEESYLAVALPVALGLAAGALLEELLFRGFPLARLAAAVGPPAASLLLAAGFVTAHLGNPALSWLGLANIGLASLLLSAVFFSPAGLPGAVGLHFGWNAGLALAADAPVSGLRFGLPALEYTPGAQGWLTGGTFGPEGGIMATVVMGLALWWWVQRMQHGTEVVA